MAADVVQLGMPVAADVAHGCADCPVGEFCLPRGLSLPVLEFLNKDA